ncbi:MAG TPA: AsmA family protein, partial [Verrucomicrobiae bacterium]|nr:AsmA family protein [Verrucomicrobiae bacterium]
MGNTSSPSLQVHKPRRWLRILIWAGGGLILLVVILYFVATSSAFFKGVILPQVSKALGAKVTVESASISPFSQVVLRNLKVQAAGAEPVLTASEVRARYSLTSILGGNIKVDEVALVSPTISLVEQPDGSKNIDAILKAISKPSEKKPAPAKTQKPSKLPQVEVGKILISGATFENIKNYQGGLRDVAEVKNFTLEVDGLQNGKTANIAIGANVDVNNNPPAPGTKGQLQAILKGSFTLALSQDLMPGSINGNLGLNVTKAEEALADFSAVSVNLNTDVTPTEIKQVALSLTRGEATLGKIQVTGPFNMQKVEGKLNLEISSIDKQALNLVGAKSGIDFGTTTISSTNQIELAKAGTSISLAGQFNINKLRLTRGEQTTPVLDLRAYYDVSVNSADKTALLKKFELAGTQNQTPFLDADLTSPMNVNWGG